MSLRAPLRVPVELTRVGRWFRLTHSVSLEGLQLDHAVPEEVDGPVGVTFHLPTSEEVALPLSCHGVVTEEIVGEGDEERAERRAIRFLDLDEDGAARIQAYLQERLGIL